MPGRTKGKGTQVVLAPFLFLCFFISRVTIRQARAYIDIEKEKRKDGH